MTHLRPLRIGDVLYGYCGGWFGRDSYAPKRVEAIGVDWVVVRGDDGVELALTDPDNLVFYTEDHPPNV